MVDPFSARTYADLHSFDLSLDPTDHELRVSSRQPASENANRRLVPTTMYIARDVRGLRQPVTNIVISQ